ncbi:MAG: ATP-dependent Clp protease adapter ClpS [bacterium]|nr:ATP-dependent Clp protease adapter ClpS [bacterium]MBU1917940.1 ATP-dependent Clp protease adapter ClpS [bacterium]
MTDEHEDIESHEQSGTLTKPRVQEPSMYKVMMLNDDYTTMDFVVHCLQKFFHKTFSEAHRIMLHVHHKGKGDCGIFPYDIAATKVAQVVDYARENEMPLKCIMEEA